MARGRRKAAPPPPPPPRHADVAAALEEPRPRPAELRELAARLEQTAAVYRDLADGLEAARGHA